MSWNYRSVADLNETVTNWMGCLPEYGLIVGVPRSGMLVASLLSLHLNLPLADLDGMAEGRMLSSGTTKPTRETTTQRVLVVDDSVDSGASMGAAIRKMNDAGVLADYAAVYVTHKSAGLVDHYAEIVPTPRFFEWNLMHYEAVLAKSCMDIDGVLCCDPTDDENDGDGLNYQSFVNEARPLYLPSAPVRWLVTSRLQRYREQTETWLAKNGVEYGQLIMMNYPDADSRRRDNAYAEFKANVYHGVGASLFIESEIQTSVEIARRTGKQVFCMETRELL